MFYPIARAAQALLVMAAVALLLPAHMRPATRLLISWNAAALTFLAAEFVLMLGANPSTLRRRAQREGRGRVRVLAVMVLICLATLAAVVFVLYNIRERTHGFRPQLFLSLATVFNDWVLLQTTFALFYARSYYQPAAEPASVVGGLRFASDEPPDGWDFFYFSFTIGANFSTSDTAVASRWFRRAVLIQSTVSFLFATVLIGLVINSITALL